MKGIEKLFQSVKNEFQCKNLGFSHTPADDLVTSQWQKYRKSLTYLIYRWIIASFFLSAVIVSLIDDLKKPNGWKYFIYLTDWGILLCLLTNFTAAILVTIHYFHPGYADHYENSKGHCNPLKFYWILHITTLVTAIVISIIYWSIIHNSSGNDLNAVNLLTHACNTIFMFIDLLVVAHPIRLLHVYLPLIFATIYAIFTYIYQTNGGTNLKNEPYIYFVLDWRNPLKACITLLGTVVLICVVHMILFIIYKLRVIIYEQINKSSFSINDSTNNQNQQAKAIPIV